MHICALPSRPTRGQGRVLGQRFCLCRASHLASCVKVRDKQRSNELGRLDLRKASDRRRVVQHSDAGGWGLVPNTRKDMRSTNWVGGAPDESLWTRIAFDGMRPPVGMLAAFGHIAEQRWRHPR